MVARSERTRRRAQRPRVYALLFAVTALLLLASVAGVWLSAR